jgi:hypothetical protein
MLKAVKSLAASLPIQLIRIPASVAIARNGMSNTSPMLSNIAPDPTSAPT